MKLRWAALVVVLALGAMMPSTAGAQTDTTPPPRRESAGKLGQNYPNPFNPETTIPFTIGDTPVCEAPGRTYRVTLRIYNRSEERRVGKECRSRWATDRGIKQDTNRGGSDVRKEPP